VEAVRMKTDGDQFFITVTFNLSGKDRGDPYRPALDKNDPLRKFVMYGG